VNHALKESKHMSRLQGKNALVAFFVGFLFGPFGVGVYLRSWPDFIVTLGLVLAGTVMTAGVGAPAFWVLCGVWAANRVTRSNRE
jgi:hypothetical protein